MKTTRGIICKIVQHFLAVTSQKKGLGRLKTLRRGAIKEVKAVSITVKRLLAANDLGAFLPAKVDRCLSFLVVKPFKGKLSTGETSTSDLSELLDFLAAFALSRRLVSWWFWICSLSKGTGQVTLGFIALLFLFGRRPLGFL